MKRIAFAASCLAALMLGGLAYGQIRQAPSAQGVLIGLRPAAQATPAQQAQVRLLQTQRGAGELNIARLQTDRLRAAVVGQTVQFQVTQNRSISARALSIETSGDATIWRGEVAGQGARPPGTATLVITGAGVTGTLHGGDGRTYRLRPLPGGDTDIVEINYDTLPQDHPQQTGGGGSAQLRSPMLQVPLNPSITPQVARSPQILTPNSQPARTLNDVDIAARLAVNPTLLQMATRPNNVSLVERYRVRPELWRLLNPPTIDVLVAYTPSAQTASGDITGLINLAIEETNGAFTNSNVWARVRLVGTMAVTYNESGRTYDTIITHFASNGDGQMDPVHAQRDALHADVAVLIINQSDWCGQAREINANAAQAFAIVHWDCATGYYSFAHEVAHLAGARHDEPTDTTDTPYAWGHGFRHQAAAPNGWRTIMGYNCGGGLCQPRLQYWSSPLNSWNGLPMGSATDADNRRVWNDRAAVVAAFR